LTGHLVFASIHTNDALSAMTRLMELGVADYLLRATVIGIMAQRLVRTLCSHCRAPVPLDQDQWQAMVNPWNSSAPESVYEPRGCLKCRNTGYLGRAGLYEVLEINEAMRERIVSGAMGSELRKLSWQQGLVPMRINGARKVAKGLTTISEVLRVTPSPTSG
jgi:general secretion pathway protein E